MLARTLAPDRPLKIRIPSLPQMTLPQPAVKANILLADAAQNIRNRCFCCTYCLSNPVFVLRTGPERRARGVSMNNLVVFRPGFQIRQAARRRLLYAHNCFRTIDATIPTTSVCNNQQTGTMCDDKVRTQLNWRNDTLGLALGARTVRPSLSGVQHPNTPLHGR